MQDISLERLKDTPFGPAGSTFSVMTMEINEISYMLGMPNLPENLRERLEIELIRRSEPE